jgi:hypothetical protein
MNPKTKTQYGMPARLADGFAREAGVRRSAQRSMQLR